MTDRDLVNATGLAGWIVANGYRQHMTRKMVLRLMRTDPNAPNPVPSAGSETVWSLSQVRCYLDPSADPGQARQYLGTEAHPDVVDGTEMARRVVAHGYTPTMSRQMVLRLARDDPDFPDTLTAGEENQERLWSWTEVEPYWQARAYPPPGWTVWQGTSEAGRATLAPDLVNATEMARRVVLCGYAQSMSPQRIRELFRTDRSFPAQWPTAGTEGLWSWSQAERSYWQPRRRRLAATGTTALAASSGRRPTKVAPARRPMLPGSEDA
jgi:hypothetical protein